MSLYGAEYGGGEAVDPNPPTVANVVQPTSRGAFFECDVSDDIGLASLTFIAQLGDAPNTWVTAYADGEFRGAFAALSTRTGAGTTGSPYHFKIKPSRGWPAGTNIVRPRILDTAGNANV